MKVVKFHLIITLIYNFSLGCYVITRSRVNMTCYSFLAFINLKLNAARNLSKWCFERRPFLEQSASLLSTWRRYRLSNRQLYKYATAVNWFAFILDKMINTWGLFPTCPRTQPICPRLAFNANTFVIYSTSFVLMFAYTPSKFSMTNDKYLSPT